ncbi:zinc-dependent metalloprotease [Dyadobacter aurulentus]|uniref:zinc-dependent metalloprotease n=1 Tax=Dyadobacter sp. UC 10 TaxID=2605428 RepID=UPI0011F0DF4A|nr:zinc-dependent metalloprotease [Dyadobacter sp. UC 10]KAA0992533.1 T9SS type A sorting domain-containing protein [Dyadobacter sp. UC 10]
MNASSTSRLLLAFLFILVSKVAVSQPNPPSCATNDSLAGVYLTKYAKLKDLTRARTSAGERLEYRLGIDINYATYQIYNGDKDRLTKEAHRFIQAASDIFEREINVKLTITYIQIWDKPEPYEFTNDFDYFYHVQSYWTANRFEERDAVVGFSCRGGWFYGGYRMCTSNFPVPDNSYIDVDLLSHELGHTLGSPHTHSCSWPGGPIDRCTNVEGSTSECEDGYPEYVNGSIMSYCRNVLSFHPLCRNLMRDYAEGKVDQTFQLGAFTEQPSAPTELTLRDPDANATATTPSFEWKAALRADRYRVQIAKDEAFNQIVEDTLVRQAHFQSRGQSQGSYFARYRPENDIKADAWSQNVRFTIAPFSENSLPPLLFNVRIVSEKNMTGFFYTSAGINDYEIELNDVNANQAYSRTFETRQGTQQSFSFLHEYEWYKPYSVRLRVRKNDVWSKWSTRFNLTQVWTHALSSANQVSKVSSRPVLTTILSKGTLHADPLFGYLEIATDDQFRNIVVRDSVVSNTLNSWFTSKMLYRPLLEENTSYYVRSRLKWAPKTFTEWSVSQLNTGFQDQRFEYLGTISPSLQNPGFTAMFRNRFYKAADRLFVHTIDAGYYESRDLKKWTGYTSSGTNGKSPNSLIFFGQAIDGNRYMMDQGQNILVKSGETYERYAPPTKFYTPGYTPWVITANSGVFFTTSDRGIGRFDQGNWYFYEQSTFGGNVFMAITNTPDDEVLAVTDQGNIWKFAKNNWSQHSFIPQGYQVAGIVFDNQKNAFAYGEFGVRQFNPGSNSWELIEAIPAQSIRKVIFDKNNRLWAASFSFVDNNTIYQSLINYKEGKANIYSDGLNILRENFDIEIFNDKLVLLTGGGELYTFEENKIQRFEAKAGYCAGEEITATITSNSSFSKSNNTTIAIRNIQTNITMSIPIENENGLIRFQLPDSLKKGTYAFRTFTSNPSIESNESQQFEVNAPTPINVSVEATGQFKKTLIVPTNADQNYQWQLNGTDIPGATQPTLVASENGDYRVVISNAGGCVNRSANISVDLDRPEEITLLQNTPNPAGNATEIAFYLPASVEINLEMFNLHGQNVMQLKKGSMKPGWHFAKVDANRLPNGIYIYRLKAGNTVKTLKMIK